MSLVTAGKRVVKSARTTHTTGFSPAADAPSVTKAVYSNSVTPSHPSPRTVRLRVRATSLQHSKALHK